MLPFALSVLLLLLFAPAYGQQLPQTTLKARTELVVVPVVVTDHQQTVRGLTTADFLLRQDGQPQTIAVFEEVEAIEGL